MNFQFELNKKKATTTRKLPFLPRFGLYIDWSGYELTYKHVPLFEAIANLIEAQVHPKLIAQVLKVQFSEIKFPLSQIKEQIFNARFRVISKRRNQDAPRSS